MGCHFLSRGSSPPKDLLCQCLKRLHYEWQHPSYKLCLQYSSPRIGERKQEEEEKCAGLQENLRRERGLPSVFLKFHFRLESAGVGGWL